MLKPVRTLGLGGTLATLLASWAPAQTATPAVLNDLQSLEELKGAFNRDAGRPRLVLLMSPT